MKKLWVVLAAVLLFATLGRADTFSGVLDPAFNTHLIAWDQYLPGYVPAITGPTDWERAYNIAVHNFSVSAAGTVTFSSQGYGLGGFDSVVSVFQGVGDSASYLHHEYSPFGPGDFSFGLGLGPGNYTLAIAMFGSEPCAAGFCFGAGTFADGFTNLVNYDPSRSLYYQVVVTETGNPVPEPATGILLGLALTAMRAARGKRSRAVSNQA